MSVPVTVEESTTTPAPMGESAALLSMIERAARDPNVDIDKMERLFQMRERMTAHSAKAAYLAALAKMQPELPSIEKRGVIATNEKVDGQRTGRQVAQSRYARWEDVVEGITPVLAKNGFSLSFRVDQPTPDRITVTAVLGHSEGHSEETSMSLPIDNSGSKNNVQGWGSSVSYGKRYTSFALLNISARGEDDDGNGATATITDEQQELLKALVAQAGSSPAKFLEFAKADCFAAIKAKDFGRLHALLLQRAKKVKK